MKWIVKAMKVGTITLDRSAMTHYKGKGDIINVPIWCAGATDGQHKVVIDTGVRDFAEYQIAEPGASQSKEEYILASLLRIWNWTPEDVDTVINTHLHVDHCGGNHLFSKAKFYVQKVEWESAFNPLVPEIPFYEIASFDKFAVSYFDWCFLDGDVEIFPGLRVITTPGHTRGHQSVLFDTKDGVVCVSGDICNIAENINFNLEPNIIVDVPATYESFRKIRRFAHYILPGHEPEIEDGSSKFCTITSTQY